MSRMGAGQAQNMTAVAIEGGKGDARALRTVTLPRPQPKPGEVLIRVRAAGLNRADVAQRQGVYPPPPGAPETLGMEAAGEIVSGAGRWSAGDRVCALLGGGGYADYVACDARHVLPVPDGMSFTDAAGLPEAILTVYANVFDDAGLKAGETFMTHGATSGIGVTAIQMAKAAGAKVIATARGAGKAAAAKALGADVVVDATSEDFLEVAKREGGVDVILDMVGGDYFRPGLSSLKPGGRIVFIAAPAGGEVTLPLWPMMMKRLTISGSTLRSRPAEEKARLTAAVEKEIWPWVLDGRVKPVIDRTFPLAEAGAAHACMEGGDYVGKLVLVTDRA